MNKLLGKPVRNTATGETGIVRDVKALLERAILAERRVMKLEIVLQEIADQTGVNRSADWARRRALEALGEVEG